jgi:hypothetical protein
MTKQRVRRAEVQQVKKHVVETWVGRSASRFVTTSNPTLYAETEYACESKVSFTHVC